MVKKMENQEFKPGINEINLISQGYPLDGHLYIPESVDAAIRRERVQAQPQLLLKFQSLSEKMW